MVSLITADRRADRDADADRHRDNGRHSQASPGAADSRAKAFVIRRVFIFNSADAVFSR